jgi:deferrochelatase/peroxidase EfeB
VGSSLSRRRFLAAGVVGSAAAAVGCTDGGDDGTTAATSGQPGAEPRYLAFRGEHQTGVTHPGNEQGLLASFHVTAKDVGELRETFAALTTEIERLMTGLPYDERDPAYPPLYTGTVGNPPPASDLSVVVSVGASLFDERYGLADRKPAALEKMPFLANDKLDPERSHGDLLLTVTSAHEDINLFALRQLMRATRGTAALRWMLSGYNRRTNAAPGEAGQRNLMGFVDGTANLDEDNDEIMQEFVWVADGDTEPGRADGTEPGRADGTEPGRADGTEPGRADGTEPAWAVGGTYHVVRVIRMFVEFWDRTRLVEQEALIGRRKVDGAPLDGEAETDIPDYAGDPEGKITPLDAHIRLANPRTPETAGDLILRKGLSFSRGFDGNGQLDQGLAFVSFQRRMTQFLNTQARLAGEPLEEYIVPVGGGFFFALPGAQDGENLADALLAGR